MQCSSLNDDGKIYGHELKCAWYIYNSFAPSNSHGNVMSDIFHVLCLQDYLNAYLPLDKGQMIKMFTQANVSVPVTQPSPQMSPVSSVARAKATLFRPDFANRLDVSGVGPGGDHHNQVSLQAAVSRTSPINMSAETWRSQILVRILVMFWMESYAYDYFRLVFGHILAMIGSIFSVTKEVVCS